jgi:hypothetical protein
VTLKTPNRVAPGKSVKCPKCGNPFVPEPAEAAAGPGTYALSEDDAPKKAGAPKPAAKPAAAAPAYKKPAEVDDEEDPESVKKGYGVVSESEEELKKIAKAKPKFTEVQDKFKKSARGPAQALMVMPSNLLTFEGLITAIGGIVIFVVGMWPLVFNDAPPGEEEMEEAVMWMLMGAIVFGWGAMVCYGASQMQELGSYPLAMTGAIMGLVPLLVGLFGIIMLLNPKVRAGFEEVAGALDEDEDDEGGGGKAKDDEDEDEDDEDDDEGGGKTGTGAKKVAGRLAKKAGRRLLGYMTGGGDDEDDGGDEEEATEEAEEEATSEDEEEEETPRKKRRKKRADEDDEDF